MLLLGAAAATALLVTTAAAATVAGSVKAVAFSEPATLPCTGQTGRASLLVNGTIRAIDTTSGTHSIFAFEGTETFTPDGNAAATYTGHATGGFDLNTDSATGATSLFRARLTSADGSAVQAQTLLHATLTANGLVLVSVDHFELQCS